jgi:cytochrome bd-type quinol oxidase subunit 2
MIEHTGFHSMALHTFEQYLTWRRERLEHRYWKLTNVIRLSGILVLAPLAFLIGGALLAMRGDPRIAGLVTDLTALAAPIVAMAVAFVLVLVSALAIHASARFRREEVVEELEVIYALPPSRPKPKVQWDVHRNEYVEADRVHS